MPRFSIVTATFNSADTIATAIESLNAQSFNDFEHVLIDGGSKDTTVDIAQQSSKRLTTIISEPDGGIYDALNKGIQLATGDFVGFLHSDDLLATKDTLARLAETLDENSLDAVYGDLQYVDKLDTSRVIRCWKSGAFSRQKLSLGWMPPHPTYYMRRSMYQEMGAFDTSFRIAADYDSLLRYLQVDNIRVGYIPEVIVKMRVGGISNRSVRNILQKSREDFAALKKNGVSPYAALTFKNISKIPQFFGTHK